MIDKNEKKGVVLGLKPLLQLGFFDDLNDEGEVPVECTFGFIAQVACAFGGLPGTDRTDLLAELVYVRLY